MLAVVTVLEELVTVSLYISRMHTPVCFQTLSSPATSIKQYFVHKLIPAHIAYSPHIGRHYDEFTGWAASSDVSKSVFNTVLLLRISNQSINQYIYNAPWYRGACYSADYAEAKRNVLISILLKTPT